MQLSDITLHLAGDLRRTLITPSERQGSHQTFGRRLAGGEDGMFSAFERDVGLRRYLLDALVWLI